LSPPIFPKIPPGHRFQWPCLPSSADAHWLVAWLSQAGLLHSDQHLPEKGSGPAVVVMTANPADALRLQQEMLFFEPSLQVCVLPDWETLPYDNFSPHQGLVSERLATLWRIYQGQVQVVLVPATTALYRLAPVSFLAGMSFHFEKGQALDSDKLKAQLVLAGYQHVSQVFSPGEYAVRGSLIDLFPMGSVLPYRVDLMGEEVDSIRAFDPDTQRSMYPVPRVQLLPGHEFPMDEKARQRFCTALAERLSGSPAKNRLYQDVKQGIASAGLEYYLPLFFEETATLLDYLPAQTPLVFHGDVSGVWARFWQETRDRHRLLASNPQEPVLAPHELFLSQDQFFVAAKGRTQLVLKVTEAENMAPEEKPREGSYLEAQKALKARYTALPAFSVQSHAPDAFIGLKDHLTQRAIDSHGHSAKTVLVLPSLGRRDSLADTLREQGIRSQYLESWPAFVQSQALDSVASSPTLAQSTELLLLVGEVDRGFALHSPTSSTSSTGMTQTWYIVTEADLFGPVHRTRRGKKQEKASDVATLVRDLSELQVGDPVVHVVHGIGRYQGLIHMAGFQDGSGNGGAAQGAGQEFLHVIYAQEACVYVPVSQLHLISRYTGVDADQAPLHRLGSGQWDKAKKKAAEQIRDSAAELLNLYARRAAQEGHVFRFDANDYEVFSQDFGFEETPDQQAAIAAVIGDMTSARPMDRLVCGDVGFGKTEVALRAVFIAILGGKQVAFLAPTTLLAEQHYQTLKDRLAKWPVRVAEMSRFRSPKEIREAMEGLAHGHIDVVVGTHKLLSDQVKFARLGLLIIDEEHRFGVRQKEAMKALRAQVDVLTLTATPIPRTLGMALEGLRDLSVIATAPQRRLSIKTFVREEDSGVIREALLRELKRGGQVYFLHNDVKTIDERRLALENLLPEARITVAHGQMPERELERVMRDFVAQRFNVLLCSTIIETGIDVPTANTIVISQADRFGLAQLHQLRGRVGRSHHQAYAYLLVNDPDNLTKSATQRLEAIQHMQELGSGFYLAMHDLEIRGVGEVLGENQSGNMTEIGFQLYNDMLSEAVDALKAGREPDLLSPVVNTEVNLGTPALLSAVYCPDVHVRLSFYKKLACAQTTGELETLQMELIDRFGSLPPAAQALVDTHRLRVMAKAVDVRRIDANAEGVLLRLGPKTSVEPIRIIELVQKNRHIQLAGPDKFKIQKNLPQVSQRVEVVQQVLLWFQGAAVSTASWTSF
jgi:transcription-repair coupling factor (superfamily II helicase)